MSLPGADFLFAADDGGPASYSQARAWIASRFNFAGLTLHSAKCTWLSWGGAVGAPDIDRLMLGHHRSSQLSMMILYARDDVLPQLRVQVRVLGALSAGWRPRLVAARGSQVSPCGVESLTLLSFVPQELKDSLPETWRQELQASLGRPVVVKEEPLDNSESSDCDVVSDNGDTESEDEGIASMAWAVCAGNKLVMPSRGTVHAALRTDESWRAACGAKSAPDAELVLGSLKCTEGLAPCGHLACKARLG